MGILRLSVDNFRSFPTGLTCIPAARNATFSPTINLLVGPNGSGKTTVLNALSLAFGRGQENSQGHFVSQLLSHPNEDFEHHDPKLPWSITATFDYGVPQLQGEASMSRFPKAAPQRFLNGNPCPMDVDMDPVLQRLYDRGFPVGWPRQLWKLHQGAFKSQKGSNLDFYRGAWPEIQSLCEKHLGTKLGDPSRLGTFRNVACPLCGKEGERDIIGEHLLDEHGRLLLHSSDGKSHFVYLIFEILKHKDPTTFLLEEPDVFMHPGLQKTLMEVLREICTEKKHQFFITTHSPYLLDVASRWIVREGHSAHIYRFQYSDGTRVEQRHLSDTWEILSDLGHRPSDVMHPNGVIWVEGPSDVMYLELWLQAWVKAGGHPQVIRGIDYEILPFGGANVAHIDFAREFSAEDVRRLVNLLNVHPNGALLLDRDIDKKDRMRKHKEAAITAFRSNKGFATLTQRRCIEAYIPRAIRDKVGIPRNLKEWNKVNSARRYEKKVRGKTFAGMVDTTSDIDAVVRSFYKAVIDWRKP